MRILITRPREDAAALAEKLKARGHEVLVEPMLEIRLVPDAKVDLEGVQAILFTSANGVRAFAAAEPRRDLPAYCVGDTTAAMAREAGFTSVESASGNVEDLANLVRTRLKPGDGALLHAAGATVAGDLAGALAQAGFDIRRAVLYSAEPVGSLSPMVAAALKARQVDVIVFFSTRTAETFAKLVREASLAPALSRAVALGLSPAIVEAVAGLPWAMTEAARQPQEADLIRAIARHKIIAQLEGKPVEEETPEVVFGRRADDTVSQAAPQSAQTAPHAAPPTRPRSRLVAVVAWLAVVLSLGTFALVLLQGERSSTTIAPAVMLRLETRLTALERQMTNLAPDPQAASGAKALADRVAALESRPAPAPTPEPDLSRRLDALEKRLAEPAPPADSDLPQRIQALEKAVAERLAATLPEEFAARVAALEAALAARPEIGQLASALAENRRQSGELARLQEQIASLGATTSRGREGLLLAVGQLREAARQGRPFATELATVQALAGDDPTVAALLTTLQPLASRAVPTREALRMRFSELSRAAGRALQTASLSAETPPAGTLGQWWHGVVRRLSSLVSVRRVGEVTGDTPAARLARAEQAVAAGDLASALAALEGMGGPAGEVIEPWLTDARARVELDRAGDALFAAALAASGAPAGTGQ